MTPFSSALPNQWFTIFTVPPCLNPLPHPPHHQTPHKDRSPVPGVVEEPEVGQLVGVLGGGVDVQQLPPVVLPKELLHGEAELDIWLEKVANNV